MQQNAINPIHTIARTPTTTQMATMAPVESPLLLPFCSPASVTEAPLAEPDVVVEVFKEAAMSVAAIEEDPGDFPVVVVGACGEPFAGDDTTGSSLELGVGSACFSEVVGSAFMVT